MKNLEKVGGISLIGRTVRTAVGARHVGVVIVSTDHPRIADEASRYGATVIERPDHLAGSTASSESAVLHALSQWEQSHAGASMPPVTVLMQCTSPFVDSADLDAAIDTVAAGRYDMVLSATESFDFQWRTDAAGDVHAVGHSAEHRPRRQDRAPHFRETGAFYAMDTEGFRREQRRFFGHLGLQHVHPRTALEIDTVEDLWLARQLVRGIDQPIWLDVDAVVTDFDGVHTDDHALIGADGVEQVRVHRGDGLGVAALRRAGVPMLILSTETHPVVRARAEKLRIESLQGIDDKARALRGWLDQNDYDADRVAYLGNDVNDLPAMALVGWPVAVSDAHPDVLAAARVVLERRGGDGAVRELCDRVLHRLAVPVRPPLTTAV